VPGRATRDIRAATPERFVRAAYQMMLRRQPDAGGLDNYVTHLRRGTLDADGVLDEMLTSTELRFGVPYRDRLRSLHLSRCDFVRMLPRAARILDLGGTDLADERGALVAMGYPYPFERLVVVDLPHESRHELYAAGARRGVVATELGPVEYRYHSMVDLSPYADASFDLVFSGETLEHVTEADARAMLREVRRVLVPGGWFGVDTPNRRVTAIQLGESLSNVDHKVEYTHAELSAMLVDAGFEIAGAFGLSYAGESVAKGVFDPDGVARHHGVYAEIDDCYLLAYVCRAPR
jgi:SAM-dependent methyltransferase